jgi:NADP-dependent 3-hydroxy acid dehydrogenase YdfG
MKHLEDRVVIVTGASSGIGEATARRLAATGARVVLAARSAETLADVADAIERDGGSAQVVRTDVTEKSDVRKLVTETVDVHGRLDGLVNNAGLIDVAPVADADLEDWASMLEVNLQGAIDVTHEALPHLRQGEGGQIVNVSSISDREPAAEYAGYNASKYGLRGFTQALREETDGQVRVTLVSPGLVETELHEDQESLQERAAAMTALQPEDVAEAIEFALSRPQHVSLNQLVLRPADQKR